MLDTVLFVVFPYVAVALAVAVGLLRYYKDRFSFSSQSSEFLEKRELFWGSVPWHYGVVIILIAHLLAFLFPGLWGALVADPIRLYTLEIIGLALALLTIVGMVMLIARRIQRPRVFSVTTTLDWVLLVTLLAQVVLGFWVALMFRWGSDWYIRTAVPWLRSLVLLQPDIRFITALPWIVKLHMLGGFVLVALFPFTRLVHIFTVPVTYLWRPYQVVIWNRRPGPSGRRS
ncbi:MAG: respiratory nitrate reductase subunit gamma [Thermomicrobiales bacterium]|nr:respiratory nitrate reductase subunit gamma [Thermomicrobiales bacterium]